MQIKMLANAEINNQELYKDIIEKANKFEKKSQVQHRTAIPSAGVA